MTNNIAPTDSSVHNPVPGAILVIEGILKASVTFIIARVVLYLIMHLWQPVLFIRIVDFIRPLLSW